MGPQFNSFATHLSASGVPEPQGTVAKGIKERERQKRKEKSGRMRNTSQRLRN